MARGHEMRRSKRLAASLAVFALAFTLSPVSALANEAPRIDEAVPVKMQVGVIKDGRIGAAPSADATLVSVEPAPKPDEALPSVTKPAIPVTKPLTFAQMRAKAPILKVGEVCTIIRRAAEAHRLPKPFLARLIWKESRFDTKAVSPVGALGIAQFMPGTAKIEGLANPFDPRTAIYASAKHLADMRIEFGNLGLAAIGYNAGRERARKFLGGNDWLPAETENYVAAILGRPAEDYAEGQTYGVAPLKKGATFADACRKLPVIRTRAVAGIAGPSARRMPWHVQISRHFARHVAIKMYRRAKRKHSSIIGKLPHVVVTERGLAGLRSQKSVRVGVGSREEARQVCARLKRAGGFCLVKKNGRG